MKLLIRFLKYISRFIRRSYKWAHSFLLTKVYLGKSLTGVPDGSIVLFPCRENIFCCGLAGIISFKNKEETTDHVDLKSLDNMVQKIEAHGFRSSITNTNDFSFKSDYLGGKENISSLLSAVGVLKKENVFYSIFTHRQTQDELLKLSERIQQTIDTETGFLSENMGRFEAGAVDTMSGLIEMLKDIAWCLTSEIVENVKKVKELFGSTDNYHSASSVSIFKKINAVLNSIDRLEVRGRDSAGISLMFILEESEFEKFNKTISNKNLIDELNERSSQEVLLNKGISIHETEDETGEKSIALAVTYKVAAEVGSLGDNINFLRNQIKNDPIFQSLATLSHKHFTVSSHTRWASVGAINEPNCHPADNKISGNSAGKSGIIHVCLNGDIDNYQGLKKEYEKTGNLIPEDITTDTKIIPLQIEKYLSQGFEAEEAFRLAVNDFEGSHAISMHTDLAPGKFFLAQKGSGQAIFVGLSGEHYLPASEVYGIVEETQDYLKLDGEIQGQIFILSSESSGGLAGIKAMYYDKTPIALGENDIKHTGTTSRDIDRQGYPHYFLKEISESPVSVEKTLQNRWKISDDGEKRYVITLDEKTFPESLRKAIANDQIRRVFFVGQGTAGVAALACSNILNYYLDDPLFPVTALKASELSGFKLNNSDAADSMADTLVVAITQSGTTTDTNRTVDMVKERGAHTIAIVNRRDSDITFKVDGVMHTSSGRDIEMSVASTKAFYSQIIAGAILSLDIARLKGRRNDDFVAREIRQLLAIPSHMRKILTMRDNIEKSAKRLAASKTYWAVVGSGPNKASADEIRIKLSELCYKTISSDYVEDKKHIDLSSEPLIIICAAGTTDTVIGDIIKDAAIFHAHKATSVVIADEGENRFDPYAEDVFHVPVVVQHLAPIVNTLTGHIWGYYAALAINEGSRFLYGFREEIENTIDDHLKKGLDIYEVILEESFRGKIARFYNEFRTKTTEIRFPTAIALASDLTLLLKYLSGKLPVSDFELDFGKKGTAFNMLNTLFEYLGESINYMARPVDAIKHQAKTVTVGTSRISERGVEGILFEALAAYNFDVSHLTNRNVIVLKNLQGVVSDIKGAILYRIGNLNILGEPTDETTIEVIKKEGVLATIPSRVETDTKLKGTKKIIVRQENVYIGKGRKDDRSIIVIPFISASSSTPNLIDGLLLLNISFKENISLSTKIKALGGKYENIKNIVQENSIGWDDKYLELVEIEELFGRSAEKIGEYIVSQASPPPACFKDALMKSLNKG